MSFKSNSILSLLIICLLLSSCKKEEAYNYTIDTQLNPYKIAPLTAQLTITTEKPSKVSVTVLGETPIEQPFSAESTNLQIPVLGLYADMENQVVVTLDFGTKTVIDTVKITTQPLLNVFPRVEINKVDRANMEDGLHGCDIHFANNGKLRSIPFIFDDQGAVRWYLDLSFHGKMVSPFQRLKDGTILVVGRQDIYELDMLGKVLKQTKIDNNYGMHHDVLEIPNGDLLICVGKRNAYIGLNGEQVLSDSDFIIQYDRKNSRIVKEWDLAKHLDVSREDVNFLRPGDWLHMNGLAYDPNDNAMIVSGRNQGLVKISLEDELQWILAPKKNWNTSGRNGDGFDTKPFLLTAVDPQGKAYNNSVQMGDQSAADFDFSWGPHAPKVLANGNLLLFDNGFYRNYNNDNNYSRAVEYKIDQENKTVQQQWQYGKERGTELFSSIISDADFLPNTENILITSGFITPKENHSAKIVEVNYTTGETVFEATLYYKNVNGNRQPGWGQSDLLYRSERMVLKY
ncbi:MAG: aryl-sulfate sulfotransferase [Gilvibacter sp.]